MTTLLIYGANGYTGELIAREAVRRGMHPILAGRNKARITALATELGTEHRIFGLSDAARHLADVDIVLHCAGPFSATSAPMIEACLASGTHYLDITGEIDVFEHAFAQADRARDAGVVLCPGVGFDIVPTDCASFALKEALPDATHLAVGFSTSTTTSPGTTKTMIEGAAIGGQVRRNGKIVRVPTAYKTRTIDFGDGPRGAMTIPLGDVSTAFYSTGIPNIEYYASLPKAVITAAKAGGRAGALMRVPGVQSALKRVVDAVVSGPSEDERSTRKVHIWAEATNAAGDKRVVRFTTNSIYDVTINAALYLADLVSEWKPIGGTFTPAMLGGSRIVTELPGSSPMRITNS